MYPKFVEVHGFERDICTVNVDHIVAFADNSLMLTTSGKYHYAVKESYAELKALIQDAGYAIHKADPRLDVTHPLTMADLKDMIGEPVWNSNLNAWLLVKSVDDLYAKVVWMSGNTSVYSEDDLSKFPLYRMRHD